MATGVGQLGHVVDVDGAGLHASMAGGARPDGALTKASDDVFLGRLVGEQGRGVVVRVMAHVVDDLHRVEILPAGIGGADVLASGARRASPAVDEVSPGEIGVVDSAKRLHVKIVEKHRLAVFTTRQRFHGGHGSKVVKEDVREGHDQVHVLGERNEEQEDTDGEHVRPVGGDDNARSGCKRGIDPVADGFPRR